MSFSTLKMSCLRRVVSVFSSFFNDTATTEIYTLSLHDALPIYHRREQQELGEGENLFRRDPLGERSEEHTSELQSPCNLVCRLLLEKIILPRYVLPESLYRSDVPGLLGRSIIGC